MTVVDVVDLALVCYRAPLAHQDQLAASAPLPEGLDRLLALANGSSELLEDAARHAGARPDELHDAARFLVQQLCFARGAGHYRVLGLEPDASFDQIKEHHRRLIQLYHPDRAAGCGTWTDGYAARINEAWTVLSRPRSRSSYDAQLPRQESQPEFRSATAPIGTRSLRWLRGPVGGHGARLAARRPWRRRAPLPRRLPMLVLGGCALAATLVVWAIYLVPAPSRLLVPASVAVVTPSVPPPDLAVREAEFARVREQRQWIEQRVRAEQRRLEAERAWLVPVMPSPSVAPVVQTPTEPASVAVDSEATSGSSLEAGVSPGRRAEGPPRGEPEPVSPQSSRRGAPQAAAAPLPGLIPAAEAAPAAVQIPAEPKLTDRESAALLDRYTGAYRSGDLDGVMALFSPDARGKAGSDRAGIRQVYGAHFASFLVRREFHDLRWALHGATASAVARYELWLRGRQNDHLSQSAGTIRLKLRKRDGQVLIEAIDYD